MKISQVITGVMHMEILRNSVVNERNRLKMSSSSLHNLQFTQAITSAESQQWNERRHTCAEFESPPSTCWIVVYFNFLSLSLQCPRRREATGNCMEFAQSESLHICGEESIS
jgi:hypothetical protein